jgi:squalene-hopene/tetraprenyl-beta-curcumene cyclase
MVESQLDDGEEIFEYDFARHGGWNVMDVNRRATMGADMSVTSHAVQGLVAAGLKPDSPTAQKALIYLRRSQNLPREERDVPPEAYDSSFTMSARESKAGRQVFGKGIVIFRGYGSTTADGLRTLLRLGVPKGDPRVDGAVRWLADHFAVDLNPGFAEDLRPTAVGIHLYYLASLSDALALHGTLSITRADGGEVRWAEQICRKLVELQRPDGSWSGDSTMMNEDDPSLGTALALLAVARARGFLGR